MIKEIPICSLSCTVLARVLLFCSTHSSFLFRDDRSNPKEADMAKAPLKYHLINPVKIRTDEPGLDFVAAQSLADEKVKSLCQDPMLISWYNATTGEYHPKTEGGNAGKPEWLNYAESRNCDMTVDINDEQFVFIYLTQP
jgi:hypothetical protein